MGKVVRMNGNEVPKSVMKNRPDGEINVGRLRLGWLHEVAEYLHRLGVSGWRYRAVELEKKNENDWKFTL